MNIEVFDGIEMKANITAVDMFSDLDVMMDAISDDLDASPTSGATISSQLSDVEDKLGTVLEKRAEIGARQNRADMMHK